MNKIRLPDVDQVPDSQSKKSESPAVGKFIETAFAENTCVLEDIIAFSELYKNEIPDE